MISISKNTQNQTTKKKQKNKPLKKCKKTRNNKTYIRSQSNTKL